MENPEPKKEWEKEFDEKFEEPGADSSGFEFKELTNTKHNCWDNADARETIKKFISETIASRDEALIALLEGMQVDFAAMPEEKRLAMDDGDIGFMNGKNCTIDQAISLIKNSEGKETV